MGIDLSGQTPSDPSRPQGILEMIHDGIGGIGAALVNGITGLLGGVVQGLVGVVGAIGSLFGLSSRDMAAVDQARVAGENAIVANMSESLEFLDEIQRVGGAYSDYPYWDITFGEINPHPLPVTDPFPLSQGTAWWPPVAPLTHGPAHQYTGSDSMRGTLARGAGCSELQESGLWMIYFQAALLQGVQYSNTPADVWCYVTPHRDSVPVGAPGSTTMDAYSRNTGAKFTYQVANIAAYGRASSYVGTQDTREGGGNTLGGYMMCYLDSPGWFVHLACSTYRHFGGASSTFVFAQKINSEDLRDDIDNLKSQVAAALPGTPSAFSLTDSEIDAMVAQAQGIEVPEVEIPDE